MKSKNHRSTRYVEVRKPYKSTEWELSLNAPHYHHVLATFPADQHRQALEDAARIAADHDIFMVWDGTGELTAKGELHTCTQT